MKELWDEDVVEARDFLNESIWNEKIAHRRTRRYAGGKGVSEKTVWLFPQKWQTSDPNLTLRVLSFTDSFTNIEKFKDLHKVSVNEDKYAFKIHYITLCL